MDKRFKTGDVVYHRHLKQFGKFIEYNKLSDSEAFVEFTEDDGYVECKCITLAQLQGVCKHKREDGVCLIGASSSGRCKFPVCSYYEQHH